MKTALAILQGLHGLAGFFWFLWIFIGAFGAKRALQQKPRLLSISRLLARASLLIAIFLGFAVFSISKPTLSIDWLLKLLAVSGLFFSHARLELFKPDKPQQSIPILFWMPAISLAILLLWIKI